MGKGKKGGKRKGKERKGRIESVGRRGGKGETHRCGGGGDSGGES